MNFRSDIDGLRGLAVLLVVFFHSRVGIASGGYVGVDVFLVISGFLITRLLVQQIGDGSFSFAAFLLRRFRRVVPAALVMVATTLVVATLFVGPRDLKALAESSVGVLAIASNVYFWRVQDYFVSQVAEQPLLHTWSLSLEEQFYLAYPVFLFIVSRALPRYRLPVVAVCAFFSFALCAWITGRHPAAAFYLIPTRAWEFLLGGLVALVIDRTASGALTRELVAAAGVIGILASAMFLSRTTPYPGIAALVPAVGTAGVIWANSTGKTAAGRMLGWRGLASIGVVSYSLYLWHWPALALARYFAGRNLDAGETIATLAVVAALTFLSWKFVEQSFRVRTASATSPKPLTGIGVLATCVMVAAVFVLIENGLPQRLPSAALTFERAERWDPSGTQGCHHGQPEVVHDDGICTVANPPSSVGNVLLWGDSHADAISPAMAALGAEHGFQVWQATYNGCPPLLDTQIAYRPSSYHCKEFNDTVARLVSERRIKRVVLAAYWSAYLPMRSNASFERALDPYSAPGDLAAGDDDTNYRNFSTGLGKTINALTEAGADVWIIKQVPVQDGPVPLMLSRAVVRGGNYLQMGISLAEHRRSTAGVDAAFARFGDKVRFVDPALALCEGGTCRMSDGNQALYVDSNHLSSVAPGIIQPLLREIFAGSESLSLQR